jgi:hypothetical protein
MVLKKVLGKYAGKFSVFLYCIDIFVQGVLPISFKGNSFKKLFFDFEISIKL